MSSLGTSKEALVKALRLPDKKGLRGLIDAIETAITTVSGAPVLPKGSLSLRQVHHYQVAPAAASATAVHAAVALGAAAQTVTTEITQPDAPRNVTVKGNQAGVTGNVVITGTDFAGRVLTETIALNGSTEVLGTKAFRTVTSIALPALAGAGDTVSVGVGKKLGLPEIVPYAACLLVKLFDSAADSGALTVNAALALNVFALNGTPDGTKKVDLYYIV